MLCAYICSCSLERSPVRLRSVEPLDATTSVDSSLDGEPNRDSAGDDANGPVRDAGQADVGQLDSSQSDASPSDAGSSDSAQTDAAGTDAGRLDARPIDAALPDAGSDVGQADDARTPVWTVVETLSISTTELGPTLSTTSLSVGVTYRLRASGTAWVQTGAFEVDAEYYDFSQPTNATTGVDQGIAIDDGNIAMDMVPDWGPYNPSHVYEVEWLGEGRPIRIYFVDGFYPNNSGSLTLEILELR